MDSIKYKILNTGKKTREQGDKHRQEVKYGRLGNDNGHNSQTSF